jgi:hypothetical protein
MTAAPPTAQPAIESLPVFGTIVQGCRAAARQVGSFVLLAIVWTALAAGTGYLAEEVTHARSDLQAHYTLGAATRSTAVGLAEYCVLLLAASLIGIAVYRAILLAEEPRWNTVWRIGQREMRYLSLAMLFSVPVHVGMRAFWIAVNLGMAPVARHLLIAIGIPTLRLIAVSAISHLFISIALTPFFVFAFPLVAIDVPGGALRRSLSLSRTYRMRLGVIGFLCSLPLIPLVYAPYFVAPTTQALEILQGTAAIFLSLLATALEAAVFAVAFQRVTTHLNKGTYDVFD